MTSIPSLSDRLENVRSAVAMQSVKDFHAALSQGWSNAVVYESANKYHRGKQQPPVKYLTRITQVFGVSATYLLTGEGPIFEKDRARWDAEVDFIIQADEAATAKLDDFWQEIGWDYLPAYLKTHFLHVWSSLDSKGWYYEAVRDHLRLESGRRLHKALMSPFSEWSRPKVHSDQYVNYLTAALHAFSLAMEIDYHAPKEKETTQ